MQATGSMSFKTAIVHHSAGGNTKVLAEVLASLLPEAELFRVLEFDIRTVHEYDSLIVGTYTWGNGELPARMSAFYSELEQMPISHLKTGVFGTGETNYNHFCGAVDQFRDMLFAKSQLVATLKIEQMYQEADLPRIKKFASLFTN
ncbi:flavodoxin domain-containing protein [Peribacillus sp. NPDC097264]|uniref:flavodoxin domain-containing protein n=1 Tax=Peribacillus sp. NPDC097264 TaxID=3390616 RepID=UPI003D09045A